MKKFSLPREVDTTIAKREVFIKNLKMKSTQSLTN